MANERGTLDLDTPPHTPIANSKIESGKYHHGTLSQGYEDVKYTLKPATRAYASTARLNLQHYLWKDQTGYLLHPSIPLSGIKNPKIADMGTGTGIWLLDLARTLPPTAQLDGFDIDISDCPHKQWLPRNVTMQQLDALGEIPEHLVGMYDIVQLRLFQVVVRDNDPGPLLRNVLRMLKPGGYLQWAEYDMTSQTTIKATSAISSSALNAIPAFVQGLKQKDGRVGAQNWIPLLPVTFHTHHLTNITTTRHATTPAFLQHELDVFLLTYEELASKTLDQLAAGGKGYGDRLREMIEAASEEGRMGAGWGIDRLVVVGRKPGVQAEAVTVALTEGQESKNEDTRNEKKGGKMDGERGSDATPTAVRVAEEDHTEPTISKQQKRSEDVQQSKAATPLPSATTANPNPDPTPAPVPTSGEESQAKGKSRRASLLRIWKRMGGS